MNKFQTVKIRIGNSTDVFHICKDTEHNGFWGISDSYVTDGKINVKITASAGNFARNYTDCIKNCFYKVFFAETDEASRNDMARFYNMMYMEATAILETKGICDSWQNVKEIIM